MMWLDIQLCYFLKFLDMYSYTFLDNLIIIIIFSGQF